MFVYVSSHKRLNCWGQGCFVDEYGRVVEKEAVKNNVKPQVKEN